MRVAENQEKHKKCPCNRGREENVQELQREKETHRSHDQEWNAFAGNKRIASTFQKNIPAGTKKPATFPLFAARVNTFFLPSAIESARHVAKD